VTAFHEFRADCIVAESNFGGEMVRATIHAADPNVPVRLVTASRGKAVRAVPISVRYAQRQVHHADILRSLRIISAHLPPRVTAAQVVRPRRRGDLALTYLFDLTDGTGIIEFYRREADARK
jgi:hypothetical protein